MHKKFIKRDGKTFGPYYYTSYREGDKIRTKYCGKPEEGRRLTSSVPSDAFYKVLLFLALIVLLFVTFPLIEKILTALPVYRIAEDIFMPSTEPSSVPSTGLPQTPETPSASQEETAPEIYRTLGLGIQETPLISFISPTPADGSTLTGNYIPVLIEANGANYKNYSYYLYNSTGLVSNDKYYREDRGVSAGDYHTCALLNNGNITCWGDNLLGPGQANNYSKSNAIGVSAGGYHTCALLNNGNVECWGYNADGEANPYSQRDAIGVSAGEVHTCALLTNGNIICWGNNGNEQANNYTQGNAIGVSAGWEHTCALLNNGNVTCWGRNIESQSNNYTLGDAIGVSAGWEHTCALLNTGDITCWGRNVEGQANNYTLGDAIGVSAGWEHTCALLNTGNITCWGDNLLGPGQANNYSKSNAIGVSAGGYHTCALLNNGNVECWGDKTYNQSNNYTLGDAKKQSFYVFQFLNPGDYYLNATSCDVSGSCNSTETRALTLALVSCGSTINGSTILTSASNLTGCAGDGLIIGANDIVLDCNGYSISGGSGYGINIDGFNGTIIKNCDISLFSYGISVSNAINNIIYNNKLHENAIGISLSFSDSNNVTNNTINSNSEGIDLGNANNNWIINNTINSNNQNGIYLSSSGSNYIINNVINESGSGWFGLLLDSSGNNNIKNNIIKSDLTYSGIYLSSASNNNLSEDDISSNDFGIVIDTSNDNLLSNEAIKSTGTDFQSIGSGSGNILINITFNSSAYPTKASFVYSGDIDVNSSEAAADSSGLYNISKYISITSTAAEVLLNVSYVSGDIPAGVDENSLKLYKYNGTDWILANTTSSLNGVDTLNKIVYANITSFSVFAPMGQGIFCGDTICNGAETCSSCPADCGTCPPPPPHCTPGTCSSLGKECGTWDDGCGGTLNCGPNTISCSQTFGTCNVQGTRTCSNGIYGSCSATDPRPSNCAGKQCGSDGCGGSCGTCPSGQLCNATNWQCYSPVCLEDWHCDDWGTCQLIGGNIIRQRYCEDWNTCGTNSSKPAANESCCSDYTPPGICSPTKPQYCSGLILIDDCVRCGCSAGELCNSTTGKCELPECINDADCPADFECKNNKCVPKQLECYSDADCPSDSYCWHGQCKKREVYQAAAPSGAETCLPRFNCTEWGNCSVKYTLQDIIEEKLASGKQERSCTDLNKCKPPKVESKSCVEKIPIRVERETYCLDNYINFYDATTGELVSRIKLGGAQKLDIELGVIAEKHCPYCEDRIKDYDEVYIDCGGLYCKACNLDNYMSWIAGEELELTLSEGTTVYFTTESGVQHSLTATKIADILSVDIKSPFSADLSLKETKKFDADGDGRYDISVNLIEIKDRKAIVKMNRITALPAPFQYARIILWIGLALLALISIREIITVARKISKPSFKKPKIEKERAFPEITSSRKKRKH